MNLYQMYLAADMVAKRLARVGVAPLYLMISDDVKAGISFYDMADQFLFDQDRERLVSEFLAAFPDASLDRGVPEYGSRPAMTVSGVTNLGIRWEIDFGTGVCERVQVGTKPVESYDPAALANIPTIIVDEPVYEYRCPDPIVAAGLVSA